MIPERGIQQEKPVTPLFVFGKSFESKDYYMILGEGGQKK
jgi:hypothetical protein